MSQNLIADPDIDRPEPIEIEISSPAAFRDCMFYHRFRTSAELCMAGLFTIEKQSPTKKHRRMKCNFCHTVLSGWKDKFCQHLDKCKYAREYFASHPVNVQEAVLQRQSKRVLTSEIPLLPDEKRFCMHPPLLTFDRTEYLTMLAVGYVCSTGATKRVYENDFLKNLAFTLHWQPPSMYLIQKRMTELSKQIHDSILSCCAKESSVTLIVYPWMDINKKCTVSYLLYTPHDMLCFLSHYVCKQENWSIMFIHMQTQQVLKMLLDQNIIVSLVLFDDLEMYDEVGEGFIQNDVVGHIPYILNTVQLCDEILSSLFSNRFFVGMKQCACTLYSSIQKTSSLSQYFQRYCAESGLGEVILPPLCEDQWSSLFSAFVTIVTHFPMMLSTVKQGISEGIISPQHPLFVMYLEEEWRQKLQLMTQHLANLVDCTDLSTSTNMDLYSVYCVISQCCITAKEYYSENETVAYVESWMQNALDHHYDPDLLCLYAVFARVHSDGQTSSLDSEIYSKDVIVKALKRLGPHNLDIEVEHELDSFLTNQDPLFGTVPSSTYWRSYGIKAYPRLSQIILPIFVYPHSGASYELLRSIKSYIHFHVRLKKDGSTQLNHSQDEMMISCNRHLLIRWDLDFQYICLF